MRLLRCIDTKRNGDIAYHTQHTGDGYLCIGSLRNGVNVERGTHKTVARTVRSRQHLQSTHFFPVIIDSQLQFITRRIGHHLIFFPLMDTEFAIQVFNHCRVTRFISNSHVQSRFRSPVRHTGSVNTESLFFHFIYRLTHRCKIVKHILSPDTDSHCRTGISGK